MKDSFFQNLLDKRKKIKQKLEISDLVRTADLKKTFSESDSTIWSYKLYKIREKNDDTIPSYRLDNLPQGYNEALLKKTELTKKDNDNFIKKLNLS